MLRRMIRDGAPGDWTPLMRDVAKEIADDARDPKSDKPMHEVLSELPVSKWPWSALPVEGSRDPSGAWRDGLAEICGATPRAISDALTRLGRARYEVRQPLTDQDGKPVTDSRGRVVFAAKGHAIRFRVPPLAPRPTPQSSPDLATNDAQRSHHGATNEGDSSHHSASYNDKSTHQSATNDTQRSHPDVSKVAPECDPIPSSSPQKTSPHLSPPVREVLAPTAPHGREERDDDVIEGKITRTPGGAPNLAERIADAVPGATLHDAEALIRTARHDPAVRHPAAWLQAAIENGTIADLFADEVAKAAFAASLVATAPVAPPSYAAPEPRTPPPVQEPQMPSWKQVECPVCEAAPGQFCRKPETGGNAATHPERRRAAAARQAEAAAT